MFYSYKGNTDPNHSPLGVFYNNGEENCDFKEVTSSNASTETSFDNIYPGKSYIYCTSASNLTAGDSVSLSLSQFISNNSTKQGYPNPRYRYNGTNSNLVDINIGWAIDIYTMGISTTTYPDDSYVSFLTSTDSQVTGTDKFQYGFNNYADLDGGDSQNNYVITPTNPLSLYSGTVDENMTKQFVFFRVYFTQADNTKYCEVTSHNDETRYTGPSRPKNFNQTRYFKAFEDGTTSSFYAGSKASYKSLCKMSSDHYFFKGYTLANSGTVSIINNSGASVATSTSVAAGTYTVDYYPNADTKVVLTPSNVSDMGYSSNCYAGLKFALVSMSLDF